VVVFSAAEKAILPTTLTMLGCSIWFAPPAGSLQPLNSFAREISFNQIQDIIYYFLPASLQPLQNSLSQAVGAERIYAFFHDPSPPANTEIPARDLFKSVYATIQKKPNLDMNSLSVSFSKRSGLTPAMIRFILDVFEELGFIARNGPNYYCTASPQKRELSSSLQFQRRLHRQSVEETLLYCSAQELSQWILPQVGIKIQASSGAYV
jgi:single-stranded-DNA-specific exonuclease